MPTSSSVPRTAGVSSASEESYLVILRRPRFALAVVVATLACAGLLPARVLAQAAAAGVDRPTVIRDLTIDERMGGHTLARHVGKTDADLTARLRREPNISAASTYNSAEMAAAAVGAALQQQAQRLESWLARRGPRPNLVLNYVQTTGPPLGRSMRRGAQSSEPCHAALVVIRWDDRARRWFVLTSYPEARR